MYSFFKLRCNVTYGTTQLSGPNHHIPMHCVSSFMNDYCTSICLFLSTKPDEQTVLKKSIKILNYYNMAIFPFFVGIINSFSGKLTACYSMISSNFRQFKGVLGTRHCFEWYWCWKLEFRSNIYWADIKKTKSFQVYYHFFEDVYSPKYVGPCRYYVHGVW